MSKSHKDDIPNGHLENITISNHSNSDKDETFTIKPISTPQDLADATHLFSAYVASLGIDLTFQDFATELACLPGKYSPLKSGALLLACRSNNNNDGSSSGEQGQAIGCVALRPLPSSRATNNRYGDGGDNVCEMKRLYVDAAGRGTGVGKALVRAIVEEGRRLGYRAMRLDTLGTMTGARKLYVGMGFVEIEAYYDTPLADTVFYELDLTKKK